MSNRNNVENFSINLQYAGLKHSDWLFNFSAHQTARNGGIFLTSVKCCRKGCFVSNA